MEEPEPVHKLLNHSSVIIAFALGSIFSFFFFPGRPFAILEGGSGPPPAFPPLFVCLCICELTGGGRETRRAETGGAWGGEHHWGWGVGGLCCNMMFILVMYLTVEDNRGLSVWLYEKNLNSNTKTFADEHLIDIF